MKVERVFDAPREVVSRACSDPILIPKGMLDAGMQDGVNETCDRLAALVAELARAAA